MFIVYFKFDFKMGEMICFGYEVKGDGMFDVCYYWVVFDGKFFEVVWFVVLVVGMIYDFVVIENFVFFFIML